MSSKKSEAPIALCLPVCAARLLSGEAAKFKRVYLLPPSGIHGDMPQGPLAFGVDRNCYGAACEVGDMVTGTVLEIIPAGVGAILHNSEGLTAPVPVGGCFATTNPSADRCD